MTDYDSWTLWQWEKEFLQAIDAMEQVGVLIDEEIAQREYSKGRKAMAEAVHNLGGCKPSSSKDLEKLLIGRLGLPLVKPTKGTKEKDPSEWKPSFDKFAMEEYDIILARTNDLTAQHILTYRGWSKSTSTYFRAFLEKRQADGRIRPNFKIHGTKNVRISCGKDTENEKVEIDSPNFQQIPKVRDERKPWNMFTKKCIIPTPGWELIEFDYHNLELRFGAVYSGQPELINGFNNGVDIWELMSSLLGGWDKEDTKTLVYSMMFGAGIQRLMNVFGVSDTGAKKIKSDYFKAFPRFKWKSDEAKSTADAVKYIQLWTGRRRHFEFTNEHRKAYNALLQGGGAELVKRALVRIWRDVCDENCRLVLTIHDSLVFEIKAGMRHIYEPKILAIMEDVPPEFGLKFTADAHIWGEA